MDGNEGDGRKDAVSKPGAIRRVVEGLVPLNSDEPLWMPAGSIRAIITLLIVCTALGSFCFSKTIPTQLEQLVGMVVSFYFGMRVNFKK